MKKKNKILTHWYSHEDDGAIALCGIREPQRFCDRTERNPTCKRCKKSLRKFLKEVAKRGA